jgi:hypothetical protein
VDTRKGIGRARPLDPQSSVQIRPRYTWTRDRPHTLDPNPTVHGTLSIPFPHGRTIIYQWLRLMNRTEASRSNPSRSRADRRLVVFSPNPQLATAAPPTIHGEPRRWNPNQVFQCPKLHPDRCYARWGLIQIHGRSSYREWRDVAPCPRRTADYQLRRGISPAPNAHRRNAFAHHARYSLRDHPELPRGEWGRGTPISSSGWILRRATAETVDGEGLWGRKAQRGRAR